MAFFELNPSQEDAGIFLQGAGQDWNTLSVSPWPAVIPDEFFILTSELSQTGWGRCFDARERSSAYGAFAAMRKNFFPISVKLHQMGEEHLFLAKQDMR